MKRTSEEEYVHANSLLDYQTRITETSSEVESKFINAFSVNKRKFSIILYMN